MGLYSFNAGYKPEVKADKSANIKAEEEVPGIKVEVKVPVPFSVIKAASKFINGTTDGMLEAGEIILETQGHNLPKELKEDGTIFASAAIHCVEMFLDFGEVKKN